MSEGLIRERYGLEMKVKERSLDFADWDSIINS